VAFWSHQNAEPRPRLTGSTKVVFRLLEPETLADYCNEPEALALADYCRKEKLG
jgi:hypothetical protein